MWQWMEKNWLQANQGGRRSRDKAKRRTTGRRRTNLRKEIDQNVIIKDNNSYKTDMFTFEKYELNNQNKHQIHHQGIRP